MHPSLYQINTRVTLNRLSRKLGRPALLDDYPDAELDRLAAMGFEWLWFLGVWQTGPAARRVSLSQPQWRLEYEATLSDFQEADVSGSCFAVQSYAAHSDFGGDEALARLRKRIRARGMRLLLDLVPNHTAPDHRWVQEHPEYYVRGTEDLLQRQPQNYARFGSSVLAFGRDPNYDGWPDTVQLNYAEPALQDAMAAELEAIASRCDGVRCDMAMLLLPDVFQRTWGLRPPDFWPRALEGARRVHPGFVFMAEVYWDLEWTLQQQGFDYTYDKRLYDRLREGHARPVREHFMADLDFQRRSARFLENHDEPRAAATFEWPQHRAAAVLTFLCPGLRFFHQGQLEGWRRRISVHLGRGPAEATDPAVQEFYDRLLPCLRRPEVRNGEWRLLEAWPAWDGNGSWDAFIAFAWTGERGERLLVVVNFAPHPSQCYLGLPPWDLAGRDVRLTDLLGSEVYDRHGDDLAARGLYLDLPAWGHNVFAVT